MKAAVADSVFDMPNGSTWTTVDVSSAIQSGDLGSTVAVHGILVNTLATWEGIGFRKKGSTSGLFPGATLGATAYAMTVGAQRGIPVTIPVNNTGQFEAYCDAALVGDLKLYVLGYMHSAEAFFFDDPELLAVAASEGTNFSVVENNDIGALADGSDVPTWAIVRVFMEGTSGFTGFSSVYQVHMRPGADGSYDPDGSWGTHTGVGNMVPRGTWKDYIVPVAGDGTIDIEYSGASWVPRCYLVGYMKANATQVDPGETSADASGATSTGSWQEEDVDAVSSTVDAASDVTGFFYLALEQTAVVRSLGFRGADWTETDMYTQQHIGWWGWCPVDAAGKYDHNRSDAGADYGVVGYTTNVTAAPGGDDGNPGLGRHHNRLSGGLFIGL